MGHDDVCDRCQQVLPHFLMSELRELLGGYKCRLCLNCANEWHTTMQDDKHYLALMILEAKLKSYIQAGSMDVENTVEQMWEIQKKFNQIGREWIEDGKPEFQRAAH